jgi:hypothetical protein
MTVFVPDTAGDWETFDQVAYVGRVSQNYCEPIVHHTHCTRLGSA